ncbi:MAG: DNA replication/repair protein RecF [Xanthomonadaceae bacterium]|jgi:DNA replication and repair protein RecF|nr:DNA replication/repair protein RecF [Xanthomonadaceae bacterium]
MRVIRLKLCDLRRFTEVELLPSSGVNLITGNNGAGKTSLLEALHLMAYGRSFRGRVRDGLIRSGAGALEVFVEWIEDNGATGDATESGRRRRRAGLRHTGQSWEGRLDGESVAYLGELCAALAVVSFEPGSHALVSGGGEFRRRFLDWGLFHVEQGFLSLWRRYMRSLKQRNALLKTDAGAAQFDVWDRKLAESGELLTRYRRHYLEALQTRVSAIAGILAPGLGIRELRFSPGWKKDEISLADALLLVRDRDRQTGYTSIGPHRADWEAVFADIPGKEALSRGQAKLTALSCLLAQAEDYSERHAEWPVVVLDDLASELDRNHQRRVLNYLQEGQAQVFITATEAPSVLDETGIPYVLFHVEQGRLSSYGNE